MEKRQATEFLEYLLRDRNIEGTIYEDALNDLKYKLESIETIINNK